MLCYVMLCYVMLCYVMLCYVMCEFYSEKFCELVLGNYYVETVDYKLAFVLKCLSAFAEQL
jgi:hypothetical protein